MSKEQILPISSYDLSGDKEEKIMFVAHRACPTNYTKTLFLELEFTYCKICYCKVYNVVVCSVVTRLCNHHYNLTNSRTQVLF